MVTIKFLKSFLIKHKTGFILFCFILSHNPSNWEQRSRIEVLDSSKMSLCYEDLSCQVG